MSDDRLPDVEIYFLLLMAKRDSKWAELVDTRSTRVRHYRCYICGGTFGSLKDTVEHGKRHLAQADQGELDAFRAHASIVGNESAFLQWLSGRRP